MTWHSSAKVTCGPNNPEIVSLHVCWDPALREDGNDIVTPCFGLPDKLHLLKTGTHLVSRESRQPLDCETLEAVVDFCRFHLPPYFQRCAESEDSEKVAGNQEDEEDLERSHGAGWRSCARK
jgi:hypothetical protein